MLRCVRNMQEELGEFFFLHQCNARQIAFRLWLFWTTGRIFGSSIYSTAFTALPCNLLPEGIMAGVGSAQFSLAAVAAAKVSHNYVFWSWLEGSQTVTQMLLCRSIDWLEVSYQRIKLRQLPVKEPFLPADCRQHWEGKAWQDNCQSRGLAKGDDSHSLLKKVALVLSQRSILWW